MILILDKIAEDLKSTTFSFVCFIFSKTFHHQQSSALHLCFIVLPLDLIWHEVYDGAITRDMEQVQHWLRQSDGLHFLKSNTTLRC